MRIVTIVGARPQFIKAATVSRVLRKQHTEILIHTGQHYDYNMSEVFFKQLELPQPDYNLGIVSKTHGSQTGRMLESIEKVLIKEKPHRVLVYGDTNSTLAGALAAAKLHIPVAHVEAGLRSFNRSMPEEINRILTDHTADLLFAPTKVATENLCREGIPQERIHLVGDVMYDATLFYNEKAHRESRILNLLGLDPKSYILVTIHRAENTDDSSRLRAIVEGLSKVAKDIPIIFPIHPRTRKALESYGYLAEAEVCLRLIEPVGYLDMVMLEKNARLIATDSGGVQKEAFFNKVTCVTLRSETEWVELVKTNWNYLVYPLSGDNVAREVYVALSAPPGLEINLYGDGRSVGKIVRKIAI
ncbi:MAG: UDP-N-acetylglucosamine 2-epimerase [Peptococcaceae bacterium BRH_c8a]|nr:MAG: UDP-N-acetylglucosamine 2-epimerase [Peptococcaceae bacterium BRH_c8a]